MTTNTTTAGSTKAPRRRRVVTDAISGNREAISTLAFYWQMTTWSQRDGWAELGRQMGIMYGKPAVGAYQAYISVNSVTLAQSGTVGILQDAPASIQLPLPLPKPMTLSATVFNATPPVVNIRILSAAYNSPVEIQAIGPVAASHEPEDGTQWVKIAQYDGLSGTGTNISSDYLAAFDGVGAGAKLCIRVVGINPLGFKGQPLQRSAVVLQLTSAASETGPETTDGGAEPAALHVG